MAIRLTITDDHPLVVMGLHNLLRSVPQIDVISTFNSGEALLEGLKIDEPDVLLLDLQMPGLSGSALVAIIKQRYSKIRILILTGEGTTMQAQYMMKQGCSGFLLKTTTELDLLIEAIESVYEGEKFMDTSIKEKLLSSLFRMQAEDSPTAALSSREKEVLELIVAGFKSSEIADKLSVGVRTIETYRRRLLEKTKAKNIAGLIKIATELRLIN